MLRLIAPLALLTALVAPAISAPAVEADSNPAPVVMLIMDEFPGAAIEGGDGQIDRARMPHLASIAEQASYYPNASTNGDLTLRAVPMILSGQLLDSGQVSWRQTLYQLMRSSHQVYRSEQYGELPALCPFCDNQTLLSRRFGSVPIRGGDMQATSIKSTLGLSRLLAERSTKPIFWTSHIILPHAPYRFLPSGDQYPLTELSQNPGIAADKSRLYRDRYLARLAQQRFLLQARFADRIIGKIKAEMVRGGIWDRAMVIITSDHGASFAPGTYRRGIERRNYSHIANVPLLIKYPGQRQAKIDRGSAQSIDLVPTIAASAGLSPDWPVDGLNLANPRPEREVNVYGAYGAGWQRQPFQSFVQSRARLVRSWNRRFPAAAERAWLARSRQLRGKRLSQLTISRSPKASAEVELRERFARVKPGSGWRPVIVSGRLRGVAPRRQLFVALNGRVVSSGYSFKLAGRARFVLLLPESKLRRGANRISLLTGSANRLIRLASF